MKLLNRKDDNIMQRRFKKLHDNNSTRCNIENRIDILISQLKKQHAEIQVFIEVCKGELERLHQNNVSLQTQNEILYGEIEKYATVLKEKEEEAMKYENLAIENAYLQERQRYLCKKLIEHINILNCLKSIPKYIKESQWYEIFDSMNIVYPNFIDRLRKDFSLMDSDLLMCCLIKLQLSNSVIAELVAINPSSVTKRKQRLKERINEHLKVPLGVEISIDAYFQEY